MKTINEIRNDIEKEITREIEMIDLYNKNQELKFYRGIKNNDKLKQMELKQYETK